MRRKWILKLVLVLFAVFSGIAFALTTQGVRPNPGPMGIESFDRGQLYPAVLKSVLTECPARDDLLQRGLVCLESSIEDVLSITVEAGEIEKLVESGSYWIHPSGILQLGPGPEGEAITREPKYKYANRLTRIWGSLDDYRFTAHSVYVTIPASMDLGEDSSTTHNLYNTHLVLPDGTWVESGTGWVNWASSPIIYTYQSYTKSWNLTTIPAGVKRDIFLKIEIGTDHIAEMHVSDPYSGKSITTQWKVTGLGHRIDLTQEQHSFSDTWIATSQARFYGSKIKRMGNDGWVDWDSSVQSTWGFEFPMNVLWGIDAGQTWTETWCSP